jgi:hypothetical protein
VTALALTTHGKALGFCHESLMRRSGLLKTPFFEGTLISKKRYFGQNSTFSDFKKIDSK